MQILLYPYAGLVTAVGLFIAALPRTFEGGCPSCGYPLTGLPVSRRLCPECGIDLMPDRCPSCHGALRGAARLSSICPACGFNARTHKRVRRYRRSGSEREDLRASDVLSAPHEAPHHAADQDHPGQPRDERPGERASPTA